MKKLTIKIILSVLVFCASHNKAKAQIPIADIISQGIKRVIIAVDLQVQRFQNETIWLQNAQKQLENVMSKLKLEEINDWMEKQRNLYADYFDELSKVKTAITLFQRLRDILKEEAGIVSEYRQAWALFKSDKEFTPDELSYIEKVYSGILNETTKNVAQLQLVINAFTTQMSDASRLEIIDKVEQSTDQILTDLKSFNSQNKLLSLQRARAKGEIEYSRKLYGL